MINLLCNQNVCSNRVENRLINYLLAPELFTKINHKPIDLLINLLYFQ